MATKKQAVAQKTVAIQKLNAWALKPTVAN